MKIVITDKEAGITIKEYLRERLGCSSAMIKKLKFTENGITVEGRFVTVRHVLRTGEVLELLCEDRDEDTSPYITPSGAKVDILYEDEQITVLNKPPFMPAHPSFGHRDDTVANALAARYSDVPYVFRPVNRLDRDTSGVMLTSNTRLASYKMYRAMTGGLIEKSYIAVLDGVLLRRCGTIETYIKRKEGSVMEREVCGESDGGKLSVTEYRTIAESEGKSLVLAHPLTGRTHQLRVHFSYYGCPITGDTLYGSADPLIARQALHAVRTVFPHPETGEKIIVTAPAPDDIISLIDAEFGIGQEDIMNLIG